MLKIRPEEYTVVMGYITLGFLVGELGPLLNEAALVLNINATNLGILMTTFFATSIVGMLLGIFIADKMGNHRFIMIGSGLLSLGLFTGLFFPTTTGLWISIMISGIALGIYQTGVNSLGINTMATLPLSKRSGRLAYLQFYFGIGAMIAPLYVNASSKLFNSWNIAFLITFILGVIPLTWLNIKNLKTNTDKQTKKHNSRQTISIEFPLVILLLTGIVYSSLESSTFNWLTYFWDQNFTSSILDGAQFMSIYWLMFSISRLTMGGIIEKLGTEKYLVMGTLTSSIILLIWIFSYENFIMSTILLIILALLLGCMVPTILVFVNHKISGNTASLTSLYLLFMTFGASGFPLIFGKLMNQYGIVSYPIVLCILAALSFALINLSVKKLSNRENHT